MTRSILGGLLATAAALAAACSSGNGDPKKTGAEPQTDGGFAVVPTGEGGVSPPTDAAKADGATPPDGSDLGNLTVVDVPDVACQAPGGNASEVTPANPNGPIYDRIGTVASRRFAVSSDGLQFFTFGAPAGGSTPVPNVIGAAGEGSLVAGLVKSGKALSLQRFDADGAASGGSIALAANNDWQAVVAGPAKTLVVWSYGGAMAAKLLAVGGTVSADVDLGADTGGAGTYAIGAVPSGTGFLITWTRNRSDGKLETLYRRVEADGTASVPQSLVLSSGDHLMVGLAPTTGGGAAMLINEGLPSKDAVVVRIDAQGAVIQPAFRLIGSGRGFGIASNNGELGIVASIGHRSGFRALASDGAALGPWYCLDDSDGGSSFYPNAAIDVDGTGYAHLTRVQNGAAIVRLVDRLGAGL